MFENREDARKFLSLLARAVRRGWIEVVAFTILTSHFHLLVRSPRGEIGKAMQWIQSRYCRWFNESRGRSGPLVTGRFFSKRIRNDRYRFTVLGYVDWNPVEAGLTDHPTNFEDGSAWHYVRSRRPRWLSTGWVDGLVGTDGGKVDRDAYSTVSKPSARQAWIVEARLRRGDVPDPEELLVGESTEAAAEWFRQRAELADGVCAKLPLACPEACLEAVVRLRAERASLGGLVCDERLALRLRHGLMREVAGISNREAAARCGLCHKTVSHYLAGHRRMVSESDEYVALCVEASRLAIDLTFSGVGMGTSWKGKGCRNGYELEGEG